MTFSDRLQTILRNRRRHHPVPEVSVGRLAELHVEAMLATRLGNTPYDYFAGVRVPSRKRRREIDFVITLPDRLLVVELKNWAGFVGVDETGNVIQHRSGGRGVINHGRLLSDLERKERALHNYLRRSIEEVPELSTLLVFFNRQVGVDERLMGYEGVDVMRLPEFMGRLPAAEDDGFFSKLFQAMFSRTDDDKPALPALDGPVRNAREELAKLGTWDLLALHGGQIVSGDLVDASAGELSDRNRFKLLRLDVPRSLFDVFRSQLTVEVTAVSRDGDEQRLEFGFDETIRFHCAGDRSPKAFELRDVEALSFGYVQR